jgi:hypothetical protein
LNCGSDFLHRNRLDLDLYKPCDPLSGHHTATPMVEYCFLA